MDQQNKEIVDAGLRKRKGKKENRLDNATEKLKSEVSTKPKPSESGVTESRTLENGSYWLTRIVLIRYVGFIYFVAFLVALHQNKELIGSKGLLPATRHLDGIKKGSDNVWFQAPSLIWLIDYHTHLDAFLDYVAYAGLGLSGFLVINGGANWFIMLSLWVLYMSLVNVGQTWYGFGWESQLLETGFLCVFLCPLFSVSKIPRATPTSQIVIWAFRWLIFRIMLGAGLIKIRGDQCWRDLTCMNFHYETQPVPNPMSYYLHQSPVWVHQFETASNHFIELVAPFFLMAPWPRRLRLFGGAIQILFQVVLILSGNLSFLNWLTIVPSLACFDDASLAWLFSDNVRQQVVEMQQQAKSGRKQQSAVGYIRRVFNISLGVLIAYLSIPVVQNLLSSRQHMNTSFEPLRLVNTYGAFGSVTKERTEVIFQGTYGDPTKKNAVWEEYEFKCKPGRITRRPCLISPYHYRLDWRLWFAAFQSVQYNPWIFPLTAKLLANDNATLSLISHNPFEGKKPPKFIRIEHYSYKYTKMGSSDAAEGRWWKRRKIDSYLQPVSLQSLKTILNNMNIAMPKVEKRKTKKKKSE